MPPTRTSPGDLESGRGGGCFSLAPLTEVHQQESRRLPGGFSELDVKKRD
jgi:hypothetical protein